MSHEEAEPPVCWCIDVLQAYTRGVEGEGDREEVHSDDDVEDGEFDVWQDAEFKPDHPIARRMARQSQLGGIAAVVRSVYPAIIGRNWEYPK